MDSLKYKFPAILVLSVMSFLGLRGGFREIPLNQSDAFFCQKKVYNIAAIHSTWNFFNVFVNNKKFIESNPYIKMNPDLALKIVENETARGLEIPMELFDTISPYRPNIVLISMEGVNAQLLKIHNNRDSKMPFLDKLIDSSYYFTKCYSVGFRTEQGLAALLSGALSTPYSSITDNINILDQLPSWITTIRNKGYFTQFLFGGNVEFANMKAYLSQLGFDKISDIHDFPNAEKVQKLGVSDEFLVQKATREYEKMTEPFLLHIMTQSTHEPYDLPVNKGILDEETQYIRSAKYLDSCLSVLFSQIQKSTKFKNTIIIITSDHAHRFPGNIDIGHPHRYHIPLIIYSNLLKKQYKGTKDTILMSQADVPATLSYLLHWKSRNYLAYSKNHFSTIKKYTFSTYVDGYTYLVDTNRYSMEYLWGKIDFNDSAVVSRHIFPMAFMQTLVDQIRGTEPILK